jgi:hypothetical protein
MTEELMFDFWRGQGTLSSGAQHPIQWVSGSLSPGGKSSQSMKLTSHHLVLRLSLL